VRIVLTVVMLATAPLLAGCLMTKSGFEYYDECSAQSSFPAMAECGRQKHNAECQAGYCSDRGKAFVQYVDALALSVKNKEMGEAEARRRYAEFKMQSVTERDRRQAAALSSGPSFCTPQGVCF
jgi:hypothetical protein